MTLINKLRAYAKFTNTKISMPPYIEELNGLEAQYKAQSAKFPTKSSNIKIVMGPSFGIYEPCFIHDRILSLALRLRGCTIIPIYCDQLQHKECNVYAGRWMGTSFQNACASCNSFSWHLWPKSHFDALPLSSAISMQEKNKIKKEVENLSTGTWSKHVEENFPLGQWAQDILVNSYMVGDFTLIDEHESLGRIYIENLKILKKAYQNILSRVKPDRVVSNDSFYGMWGVLQKLCEQEKVPFYSQWEGDRKDAWCYAYNDAAMNLNFAASWASFSQQGLTVEKHAMIDNWIKNRVKGSDMILNTAAIGEHHTDDFPVEILNSNRPKALLSANVIWDCAALNKQVLFNDMMDWIIQTIYWFELHPQYELIIKPHPVEENPLLPQTVETVKKSLEKRNIKIPSNVHLLSAKVKLTVYDLFPHVEVGLVHTSSVGMEMAAIGKPVITSARSCYRGFGFTTDPYSSSEYFSLLDKTLSRQFQYDIEEQKDKAYKFIFFYRFHYYTKIGIMEYEFSKQPKVLIKDIEQLKPGVNPAFDYIIDSIIEGAPIISENRWMSET